MKKAFRLRFRRGVFLRRLRGLGQAASANAGFLAYTAGLLIAIGLLPAPAFDPKSQLFLLGIGVLAMWRYTWGLTHFTRSVIYRKYVFPRWRSFADRYERHLMPSELYILVTLYRIKPAISARVIHSIVQEARNCGLPVTIVASIVEPQDESLFKDIFLSYGLPDTIKLKLMRAAGSGKRVGLTQGLRSISQEIPAPDALVVVMDGDTVLTPGSLRKSLPFFKIRPQLGAVTTDELCELEGTPTMREWHEMRFAQRHVLMSSMALSRRVMTLTGRMSVFRASIVTSPGFIDHMMNDHLDHWRLGRFKFLTGDDKSSLYYLIKKKYEQIYLPDVKVRTLEDPPSQNFLHSSTILMFRWFGNMLRTNARILRLGPAQMPFFVWWSFLDQRLSMWTTLCGPVFATMLAMRYGLVFFAYYFVWVGFIRWVMSLMLLSVRKQVSWRYPFLLYYNQVVGALIKTWVMFHLDMQTWTRQKTFLNRNLSDREKLWHRLGSDAVHATAVVALICAIGYASSTFIFPHAFVRAIAPEGAYTGVGAG